MTRGRAAGKIGEIVRRAVAALCLLSAALASPLPAAAQARSLEYPVKANYLVKFAAFVDWPSRSFAHSGSPVVICVVGDDPFGSVIDRAAHAGSGSMRQVVVRRTDRIDSRSGCHVAYIGASPLQTQAQALAALQGQPVLTVTDSVRRGPRGVIHFAIAGNRVRFHIDDRAAQGGGLVISSRLLALAISVRPRA